MDFVHCPLKIFKIKQPVLQKKMNSGRSPEAHPLLLWRDQAHPCRCLQEHRCRGPLALRNEFLCLDKERPQKLFDVRWVRLECRQARLHLGPHLARHTALGWQWGKGSRYTVKQRPFALIQVAVHDNTWISLVHVEAAPGAPCWAPVSPRVIEKLSCLAMQNSS